MSFRNGPGDEGVLSEGGAVEDGLAVSEERGGPVSELERARVVLRKGKEMEESDLLGWTIRDRMCLRRTRCR